MNMKTIANFYNGKSIFSNMVLRLMRTEEYRNDYCKSLELVLTLFPEINREVLEKEIKAIKIFSLNNDETFTPSDSLLQSAKEKQSNIYLYIDYRTHDDKFCDKVLIEYLCENYKDNIIVEDFLWDGVWCGQNAIVFGSVAEELWNEYNSNLLDFADFGRYYYRRENEEKTNFVNNFISDNNLDSSLFDLIFDYVDENANLSASGVYICKSDLIDYITYFNV